MAKQNLELIAKQAHVSVATVSRALNGLPGVSKEKISEIKAIVEASGFKLRQRKRSSARGKGTSSIASSMEYNTVAIVVGGDGFLHAADVFLKQLHPISRRCAEMGITVIIVTEASSVDALPWMLRERRVDGLFYFGDVDPAVCEYLSVIPSLWMTSHRAQGESFLLAGNSKAGVMSAEYFHEQGIGSVIAVNPFSQGDVVSARALAFEERAKELGMTVYAAYDDFMPSMGDRSFWVKVWESMAGDMEKADGVFFPADWICANLYPFMVKANFFQKTKGQVISCGGMTSYLHGLDPEPVTIDFGFDIVGQLAVDQLLWKIRNPDVSRQISVAINPVVVVPDLDCG